MKKSRKWGSITAYPPCFCFRRRSDSSSNMNLSLAILAVSGAANLTLALVVLAKRRSIRNDPVGGSFVLSVFFVLLWSLFNFLADNAPDAGSALLWTRATFPASLAALLAVLWFSYVFPAKAKKYGGRLAVYALWAAAFSVLAMSKHAVEGVELDKSIGVSEIRLGGAYPPLMAFYVVLLGAVICNLRAKFKKAAGLERRQIKYVIIGWGAFLSGAFATNLIIPYFTGNADWSKFGPLFSVLMTASVGYAVAKHRLMDIRLALQKSVVFTLVLACVTALYLALIFLAGYAFQKVTGAAAVVSAGITAAAGIFGAPALKRRFIKATDRVFFKDKYDYSKAMRELSEILNKNITKEEITAKSAEKLKEVMKADGVSFSLGKIAGSEAEEGGLSAPITLEGEVLGGITLGKKLSGDPYSPEDAELLNTFACQAGVALKKAELYERIQEYSRELEEKVERRTAEIKALQEEQKRMIMDISHGLQTPLTVIKGELGVLRRKNINAENFAVLERSIDRISRFIYDLLRLSRLETSSSEMRKKPVNLSRALNELLDELKIVAKENGVAMESDIERGIVVPGDENRLEELVTNLVSNAMKYIANERKIFIGLKEKNGKAELKISDTGIGISGKDLPHVFKRFYRVKEGRHADARGTGLGLAICRKIAEKHGGTIKAESEPGKGTTFTVVLPAIRDKSFAPKARRAKAAKPGA